MPDVVQVAVVEDEIAGAQLGAADRRGDPTLPRGVVRQRDPGPDHAANVSPEQSYACGPSAPHEYGLPICAQANVTASPAAPPG